MLSVIMLSAIMLSAIMLNVVAPDFVVWASRIVKIGFSLTTITKS
jgi:hypothetical protein